MDIEKNKGKLSAGGETMINRRNLEEDSTYVAGTEDDIASRLEASNVKLDKKTATKAEQTYFAPNPYEFME